MREPHPLAVIHDAVLEFLRGRDDAVLYGAQAVNAYIDEPRMTQDVDIASPRAAELAEELRRFLNQRFRIAVRAREIREGLGYRICQVRRPKNRHLVDPRPVNELPPAQRVRKVLVVIPPELIANKVMSMVGRQKKRKGTMDRADLMTLFVTFPELKTMDGEVAKRLRAAGATPEVMTAWKELVEQEILPDEDEGY
ncbi:MAG: nucleotidyl transferase AbiEii/AbiGii toxin family protein [Planctomycetota bacterium]|nr:MAG: nucleotidyl transferase AbiEii/AbiGii toxin family protein [Planctomycetota bacterium]